MIKQKNTLSQPKAAADLFIIAEIAPPAALGVAALFGRAGAFLPAVLSRRHALDEHYVLTDLYHLRYGNELLVAGQPEALAAGDRIALYLIFWTNEDDVAYMAEVFAVVQTDNL